MPAFTTKSLFIYVAMCVAVVAVVCVACLGVGSTGIGWHRNVIADRLDSVLNAALVGAALAAAGVAYQAILRNPLADPYLLGASSGAMLAAFVWQLPMFAAATGALAAISQQAFAFIGASLSVLVALALASRRGKLEPITLLLVGVIINVVNGSIFLLVNELVKNLPGAGEPLNFLVGGIQTVNSAQRIDAAVLIGAGFIGILYFAGQLNAAALDEAEAKSLGVALNRLRWITIALASLVTAAAVAISGPIGFVGLVCPHLARLFCGNDHRRLIPVSTCIGATLLMLADALCRFLAQDQYIGTVLRVGVITGLLGGPFFLILLFRAQRARE